MVKQAKPFVKWAGGKTQLLHEIRAKYPAELGTSITKYAEPFVGGGAVLFDVLANYKLDAVYISDINRDLISVYQVVCDCAEELICLLEKMQDTYYCADETQQKLYYYSMRERYNTKQADKIEHAAQFIFLNRTCFNGLYRVNARGQFNVPMGSYKKPVICDAENLHAVSHSLKNVQIVCADYQQVCDFIDDKTFAYFDPPYRPLSQTSNFKAYAREDFCDLQQMQLAHFIDDMTEKGAVVLVSNADPKNTNETDDFFDHLYARHNILRVNASRAINSVGASRGKVRELLICNT